MDPSPENLEEQAIIREEYKAWEDILKTRGRVRQDSNAYDYGFGINRSSDRESRFTVERVEMTNGYTPQLSEEGERWLLMTITPQDVYRSKIGMSEDGYYTEGLRIYLSDHDRAFQEIDWIRTFILDYHAFFPQSQLLKAPHLKVRPNPDNVINITKEELEKGIEPIEPLSGQNLERLKFLLMQVKRDNISE